MRVTIGAPPRYIGALLRHARAAMLKPEVIRRWKQPFARFVLLEGITGSGKTTSIEALNAATADLIAEITGTPRDRVPPRVFRLKPAQIFSKWFGESDRNLADFFTEVRRFARTPYVAPDGRVHERVPMIGVIEELDGMARRRGQGEPIYDRIMATLLQHLDPGRAEVDESLVFWVATTNLMREVDPAALRRVGGTVERFGTLSRAAFADVLRAHLDELPVAGGDNGDAAVARERLVGRLTEWLYAVNGPDAGQVRVIYANGEPEVKFRRDFLTGAVVARSVGQAAAEGCDLEFRGAPGEPAEGLTAERLMEAFDRQVRAVAEQLSPANAGTLIVLREGGHVSDIQRLRQPVVAPYQLRKVS
jgi:hypothetical protein